MYKSLLIIVALASTYGIACQSTLDCNVGSVCVSPGVCVGGLNPGENTPTVPGYGVPQVNTSPNEGRQCSFDSQCGYGGQCLKARTDIFGVCR